MLEQVEGLRIFLNPKLPEYERAVLLRLAQRLMLKDHVLLASSGTSGKPKLIALSQAALQNAAQAVNQHIQASSKDVWGLALPLHHIGGFSITVRAKLSNSKLVEFSEKWSAQKFTSWCEQNKVSLSSLVPTQVWDLVEAGLKAPQSLRVVFVGGAALSPILYERARKLGWPILPCYGMTETCAQVACASLASLSQNAFPKLELFSHVQAKVNEEEKLSFSSAALLSCLATEDNGWISVIDPKQGSWFISDDYGEILGKELKVFGRGEDFVKIAGEAVSLLQIQNMLEHILPQQLGKLAVLSLPHARLGESLALASEVKLSTEEMKELIMMLDAKVLPIARIQQIYFVQDCPKTALGKTKRMELRAQILAQSTAQILWQR